MKGVTSGPVQKNQSTSNWPGSATILAVRCKGRRDGKPVDETRYYVTSLRTTATALLQHVRDRWSIENSWHWPRRHQRRPSKWCNSGGAAPA